MNLRRIAQLIFANFLSQGVSVVTQLLIPPFFLHFYSNGIEVYGEWIALSASINYLGTLNYGIQTYANNQMTILYNRGDVEGAKTIQSSALRLLLLLILLFVAAGSSVMFIPIASLLRLKHVGAHAACVTLYLLIIQIAVNMIFSLLSNSYMVVGLLHRGNYWASAQRLFTVLSLALAIWLRSSFPVLAAVQLGSLVLFLFLVFIDIRKIAPVLLPSLRYGTWKQVLEILKPSAHFGIIALAGFLTWQGPVLLIQRVLGPAAVGVFALVRVVFQMSRQLLSIASSTISQDITLLVGQRNWQQLRRLYDLSERVVLFLIPIVSLGSLLMCPFLFTVWLHKRALYQPLLCILMAIVSAVLGIKEHKTQFQSSSNEHETLSVFIFCGYSVMLLASILPMKAFGLAGFIVTWLIWEIIQTGYVLHLNTKLFPPDIKITAWPVLRLSVFMTVAFALAAIPAHLAVGWTLSMVVAVAVSVTAVFGGVAYFVFGVDDVRSLVMARIKRRFAQST